LVFTLLLAACTATPTAAPAAQSTSAPATSAAPAAASATVMIQNYAFDPLTLTVKVGTTVTWTNGDNVTHTVTSDTGLFDSGDLAQGATFSYTFTTAGTYAYHCTPHHATMSGTIIVTN
jgi:plastocyanin